MPDRQQWEAGYAKVAKQSILPIALSLDEAMVIVGPLANPLLDGTAHGHWNPRMQCYTPSSSGTTGPNIARRCAP